MTSADLDRLEHELGIRLPSEYRALVLTYPHGLGPSGPDYQLLDDPSQLIATNRLLREQGFFGMPWPPHYFAFGSDGFGNEYYLDLRKEPSPVYVADHEGTLAGGEWPSLEAWLAERVAERAAGEAERRARTERKARKRWWRFWT